MTLPDKTRNALRERLETADFQRALETLRDLLRRHLIAVLGGDWEKIHNEYGMYTMNCRVKGTRRVLEKYDRLKRAGDPVDQGNFCQFMPDLVGGRLVVVDPGDLFALAERVRANCISPLFESPRSPIKSLRVRHGKFSMYDIARFETAGYDIEIEATGYCSVHFVFRPGTGFFEQKCHDEEILALRRLDRDRIVGLHEWHLEIQIRTIMDEAWGETDHFVRYQDPSLKEDSELRCQFAALAAYLQAANHHVSLIRETARRKGSVHGNTRSAVSIGSTDGESHT